MDYNSTHEKVASPLEPLGDVAHWGCIGCRRRRAGCQLTPVMASVIRARLQAALLCGYLADRFRYRLTSRLVAKPALWATERRRELALFLHRVPAGSLGRHLGDNLRLVADKPDPELGHGATVVGGPDTR